MISDKIILTITLILFSIILILTNDDVQNWYSENFSTGKLTEVKIGPFSVSNGTNIPGPNGSNEPNLTKIFIYNPSIEFGKDGRLYCVSRLTGRHSYECKFLFNEQEFEKSDKIDSEIKRFPKEYRKEISSVVYFPLDDPKNFKVLYEFDMDNLCTEKWIRHSPEAQGLEDPRLFTYKDELWVYSHYRGGLKTPENSQVLCQHVPIIFKVSNPKAAIPLVMNGMTELEKNWMPFEHNGELYFEYNIYPHTILKCNLDSGYCTRVYETYSVGNDIMSSTHLGGGSPSKLFTDDDGILGEKGKKYFLGFAHTRETKPVIRKNFFYVFEASPPFNIKAIGSEIDVIDKKIDIEFGSGMVIKDNKTIIISVGISDCYGVTKDLDLKTTLKTLRIL